jgi:cytochrome c oxidase subunit 3
MSAEATASSVGATDHLRHHFDSPRQQFESGKLGMWLFLATELLMFGGLFCAYAVYRASHPEVFVYAHRYLDANLGGINTLILICSSLTMAWAVRAAQLGQRDLQILMLTLTIAGGIGFMGIKAVEYEHKWKHGLMWGTRYDPTLHEHAGAGHAETATGAPAAGDHVGVPATGAAGSGEEHAPPAAPKRAPLPRTWDAPTADRSFIGPAAMPPPGLAPPPAARSLHAPPESPANVHLFFGIYFAMTGLHAVHVLVGIFLIYWLLLGALRGKYGPSYFVPVDNVGLYWHVVDMIWIFLFPLLYLIH